MDERCDFSFCSTAPQWWGLWWDWLLLPYWFTLCFAELKAKSARRVRNSWTARRSGHFVCQREQNGGACLTRAESGPTLHNFRGEKERFRERQFRTENCRDEAE